jgi:hypothetical protein
MTDNSYRGWSALKIWGLWTLGFLSFPVAGIAGELIGGPVDSPLAAALGGAVTGMVIGTGQSLVSAHRLRAVRWIPATTIGMAVGLLAGASIVGYGTSPGDLAVMGAVTGVSVGLAQAVALPSGIRRRWAWAVAMPALWALGWTISTLVGVDVETQYTVFGSSGAITVSALAGLLLHVLARPRPTTVSSPATPIEVSA